jgi:hypothetical protein
MFNSLDSLTILVHPVVSSVGSGRVTTKVRPHYVMSHIKRIMIDVKAEINCLVHALIIVVTKATNNSNYKAYRKGWKIFPAVQNSLQTTGIVLSKGAGIP